ncbi:MAG: CvpA family protein [Clostridia bacterium]|nr:CvpA family protein [Clostridia bacterium]
MILSIVVAIVAGAVAYYFMLPALNFKSTDLYMFLGIILAAFVVSLAVLSGAMQSPEYLPYVKKKAIVPVAIGVLLAAVVGIGMLVSSVFFRADSYSKIITIDESKSFATDIEEANFQSVPVLDVDASTALATRALGDLASINMVSQFEVSSDSTQINYKNSPIRVTTLAYGDIFKWLKNTKNGLPGYILVDMVTQKSELVMLEEGNYIKYSTQEHFGKYLMRHVRFEYPTYIFDAPHFEIDESGRPYWLCPVLDKTIGLFGGTDVIGVVIVDAITGEFKEYTIDEIKENKDIQWIDVIYSTDLLVEQYNYYGQYSGGFINSIIGQEGVKIATEGSNFLAMNDDVYMYTGVTSAGGDQAIIGFVLVNMRTKDANFYTVSGAKEYSARDSAQGAVQDYKYTATFPILLNISGEPTYFMSLKDSSNLVKRFAMVNVQNYQVVVTGETIAQCTEAYVKSLKQNNINIKVDIDEIENATQNTENENETPKTETKTVKGKIADIRTAVMGGESVYFIRLEKGSAYYTISASNAQNVVILNIGDSIKIEFEESDEKIIEAISIK